MRNHLRFFLKSRSLINFQAYAPNNLLGDKKIGFQIAIINVQILLTDSLA